MFMDLITRRRSIRKFEARPVEREKIDLLVEAALRSPSSRGFNPWEFVVVTDREAIAGLSEAKPHGASFVRNAPLVFVVCGDPERADTWVEDTSIASIFIHLAAADLDLGSCWVQIRMRGHSEGRSASDYITDLLNLPKGLEVLSLIAIGYPAEEKAPHARDSLEVNKVSCRQA